MVRRVALHSNDTTESQLKAANVTLIITSPACLGSYDQMGHLHYRGPLPTLDPPTSLHTTPYMLASNHQSAARFCSMVWNALLWKSLHTGDVAAKGENTRTMIFSGLPPTTFFLIGRQFSRATEVKRGHHNKTACVFQRKYQRPFYGGRVSYRRLVLTSVSSVDKEFKNSPSKL